MGLTTIVDFGGAQVYEISPLSFEATCAARQVNNLSTASQPVPVLALAGLEERATRTGSARECLL
jgi:hypothetical protein